MFLTLDIPTARAKLEFTYAHIAYINTYILTSTHATVIHLGMRLFINSNPITSIIAIYYTLTTSFISIPILAYLRHTFHFPT